MDAQLYALPIPRCPSCGKVLSHLYPDHLELTSMLTEELKRTDLPTQQYIGSHTKMDITNFITTYYTWRKDHPTLLKFEPNNVVARALIATEPLKASDLPFGSRRSEDGQPDMLNHQLCCLRTFQSNPLLGI